MENTMPNTRNSTRGGKAKVPMQLVKLSRNTSRGQWSHWEVKAAKRIQLENYVHCAHLGFSFHKDTKPQHHGKV
jgi:hypothetical protein